MWSASKLMSGKGFVTGIPLPVVGRGVVLPLVFDDAPFDLS
jgi:hypothetical protein